MRSPANWKSLLRIALVVAALLNLETVWQTVANYSYTELASYTSPLQIFGGLAIGKVIGILFLRNWPRERQFFLAIFLIVFAWVGIIYLPPLTHLTVGVPTLAFIWLTLPFVGFGVLLVDLFSKESLMRLVVVAGIVGAAYFAVFPFVTGFYSEELIGISLGLLALALTLEGFSRWLLGAVVLLALVAGLVYNDRLTIPSSLERERDRFVGAQELLPPDINLLFRTDLLYLPQIGRNVLTMNGSRFMVLPTESQIRNKMSEPLKNASPSYDTPYLFGKKLEKVLVIGPAGGKNVLAALANGATDVTGVDINPSVFHFLKEERPDLIDNLYLDPRVTTVRMEGRHFLETTDETFDLIVLQGVQTGTQAQNSSTALLESFLFTEEALTSMWKRLKPGGAIFFDEYDKNGYYVDGLLKNLALVAPATLGIEEPERQVLLFRYFEDEQNPGTYSALRTRAGLTIWKTPLEGDLALLKQALAKQLDVTFASPNFATTPRGIDDNRPIFIQELGFRQKTMRIVGAFFLLLCVGLFAMRKYGTAPSRASVSLSSGLLLLGAAYILCVMSFWGPVVLLTGEPFVVGPLVYFSLYFFGLLGGLLALRVRRFSVPSYFALGCTGILLAWGLVEWAQLSLLQSHSTLIRYGVGGAAVSLLAFCFELPYIVALKSVKAIRRGEYYTYEALGTFLGAGISLMVQPLYGFIGSFITGVVCLTAAGCLFYRARRALED